MSISKKVIVGPDARKLMKDGVDVLANAVKATLGPRGRHVAIETRSGPPIITKDGVTVARHINLSDRVENMGAQLVKSVASAANNEAGDGTTTATVLAQVIYSEGLKQTANGLNPVLIKRGIDLATASVVEKLKEISVSVADEKTLYHVAKISANNDHALGKLISEAVSAVGNDGIISVEEATGNITEVQYVEGIQMDRGWLSESFVTNPGRNTSELDDPYILICDLDLKTIHPLVNILNKVIDSGRPLLIITRSIEVEALAHIVLNHVKNAIRCCVVRAPGFGDYRAAFLGDLAIHTNGGVFTGTGAKLEDATLSDLGSARKIIVSANSTKIIGGVTPPEIIEKVILQFKEHLKADDILEHQSAIIRDRIARLSGGAAIIKVGATSEGELREKKDRIEDAINAVKSALSEGVVPGGGSALLHCISALDMLDTTNLMKEEIAGIRVVRAALEAPFYQILKNAGVESKFESLMNKIMGSKGFSGYDALSLSYVVDMLESGIIDPTKVVRSAIEHATSASGTLLTTEVVIFDLDGK